MSTVRFKRLTIEDIFGPGSHTIDIEFRQQERVTVLHGRNGSGKTITLGIIAALRKGDYRALRKYPFQRLTMELSTGASLVLTQSAKSESEEFEPELHYILVRATGDTEEGIIRRFFLASGEPASLKRFRNSLPPIKFIRTDRLFIRQNVKTKSGQLSEDTQLMVEHLSQKIRALAQAADQQYRLTSTELDASLPLRIFKPAKDVPDPETLRARSQTLRESEQRLHSLGLLQESPRPIAEETLTREQLGTFSIILDDREKKLAPFADLADKAERLLKSLNRKLAPKQIRLNVESGYQVFTAAGDPLPLDQLSSGEQHELVLLHELLFDAEPGTLILIDEPELSLHVTWQSDVLPELLEVAKLSQLDFVLATHSPYIVGDEYASLMVRLGDPQ